MRAVDLRRLADLDDAELRTAYDVPRTPWLRLNYVATLDGAAQGHDGLSRSINNAADQRVFRMLRSRADAVMAGAGTIRAEAYRPNPKPLVVVTRSGGVPPSLRSGDLSQVWIATGSRAPLLLETRELVGERALVLGEEAPDLRAMREALAERGFGEIVCEGGPELTHALLEAGLVDELCLTTVPRIVAGGHLPIVQGPGVDVALRLHGLLESDGTLLGRWLVERR